MRTIDDTIPPRERTLAPAVLGWVAAYLVQPDGPGAGEPLALTAEQARIVARWYAIDDAGRFVYRRGSVRRMKGWGKSPFGAALAAVELCGPSRFDGFDADGLPVAVPHPAPWVVLAAVSMDQTRNTLHALLGMVSNAAVDEFGLDLGRTVIHSRAGGRIEAVTSNPRTIEGARASFTVLDESQEWLEHNRGVEMASAIRRNAAKLGTARTLELANAHRPDEGSVAEASFEAWRTGRGVDDVMYDSVEAPAVDDLDDAEALRAALEVARGDSTWLDLDRIAAEVQDPATPPSVARRYYLNQAVEASGERFMDAQLWDSLARPDHEIRRRAQVVLGFDGGYSSDHTALVVCEIAKDGGRHLDLVKVWAPDGSPGWTVPVLDVEREIRDACERWDVREVVADPSRWQRSLELLHRELHREGRRAVVAFPQQSAQRMSEATNSFLQATAIGTLTHSGDALLRRYMLNAIADETPQGYRLRKRTQREKIDAAVAAVMAHHRSLHFEHYKPRYLASSYENLTAAEQAEVDAIVDQAMGTTA